MAEREPYTAFLSVKGLEAWYGESHILHGVGFEVGKGELVTLLGRNGAGKTTTLRTIAGVLPVKEGRIVVGGFDLARDEERAKRNLRWIPDDPQPFDALTVLEHLEFTAALYGQRDWRARADELLERFELSEKRDAFGGELSRGMRQKLAFCCAWIARPALVLMDEPLSGLDPRGIRSAKHEIEELARAGTAVILSSHLLVLIEELATRLLILDRGRKVFEGTLDEARSRFPEHSRGSLEEIFFAATGEGAARTGGAGGAAT